MASRVVAGLPTLVLVLRPLFITQTIASSTNAGRVTLQLQATLRSSAIFVTSLRDRSYRAHVEFYVKILQGGILLIASINKGSTLSYIQGDILLHRSDFELAKMTESLMMRERRVLPLSHRPHPFRPPFKDKVGASKKPTACFLFSMHYKSM